ncbi:hypothetical protein JTE90_009976, partial [Oedothorax gibbosus]
AARYRPTLERHPFSRLVGFGREICYNTLSEFRLPWPSSDCLEHPTLSWGLMSVSLSDALTGVLVISSHAPVLLTKSGPHWALSPVSSGPSVMQGGLLTMLKFGIRFEIVSAQGL